MSGLLKNTSSAPFSLCLTTPLRLMAPLLGSLRKSRNRTSVAFFSSPGANFFVVFFLLSFTSFIGQPSLAAEQAGKDFPLLHAGLGARPVGLGGAYTAIANDANAVFWNPAGTLLAHRFAFETMQTRLASDLNVYYVSTVVQQRSSENATADSAIGLMWINAGMSEIPLVTGNETTVTSNTDVKPYDYSQFSSNAVGGSFSWWAAPNVAAGVNVTGIYQDFTKVTGGRGGAVSVTPGIIWLMDYRWALGATIRDSWNYQKWGTGTVETVIPEFRLGISGLPVDWALFSAEFRQKTSLRYATTFHLGSELNFWELVRLRVGYDEDHLTAGCGLYVRHVAVNYAFSASAAQALGDSHRVSLEVNL